MSGGGGGEGGQPKRVKKHSKRKPKKRVHIRIDMTPLVDVAFLLLTFFMLTTVFRQPQTMEINLPPDNKTSVELPASKLMTIMVDEANKVFWYIGEPKDAKVETIEFANLRTHLMQQVQQVKDMVFLIKIDRKSKFKMMIDILDELNLGNLNRFALAPLDETDKKLLLVAGGTVTPSAAPTTP